MGNLSSLLSLCLESFKNAESVFLLRLLICHRLLQLLYTYMHQIVSLCKGILFLQGNNAIFFLVFVYHFYYYLHWEVYQCHFCSPLSHNKTD